jgi:hypothetical protein
MLRSHTIGVPLSAVLFGQVGGSLNVLQRADTANKYNSVVICAHCARISAKHQLIRGSAQIQWMCNALEQQAVLHRNNNI